MLCKDGNIVPYVRIWINMWKEILLGVKKDGYENLFTYCFYALQRVFLKGAGIRIL